MLTAKDVREIIAIAKASDVLFLEYAGLKVTFKKSLDAIVKEVPHESTSQPANQPVAPRPTRPATPTNEELAAARQRLADLKVTEEMAQAEEQVEARELELAQLAHTDPEAFERELLGAN